MKKYFLCFQKNLFKIFYFFLKFKKFLFKIFHFFLKFFFKSFFFKFIYKRRKNAGKSGHFILKRDKNLLRDKQLNGGIFPPRRDTWDV